MNACERPARHGPSKGLARTGTRAGYYAHQRAKEAACEACTAAQSDYNRQWHERNRASHLERMRQWHERNRASHLERMRQRHERYRERYWANRTPSPDEDEPRWTVYRALYLSPDFDNDPWHGAVYYVGQTCRDPEERWTEHVQSKRWLDNTLWQVVEAGLTRRQAFDLENALVDEHYSTLSNDAAVQRRDAEDIPHPPYRAYPASAFM